VKRKGRRKTVSRFGLNAKDSVTIIHSDEVQAHDRAMNARARYAKTAQKNGEGRKTNKFL
jgi:hypothetical protein